MNQCRNSTGGNIDRNQPLQFTFDGKKYKGYQGDTLASALLANGIRLVGRSFKYHRPRGIFGMGIEEPSAMVQLRTGARSEPNIQATQIELYDGLVAASQNRWPTLKYDIGSLANVFSPFLPAGFYYKTFMWPATKWMLYEKFIRKAAGLGKSATVADPDTYSKIHDYCDVLVVGGGPAGIAATLSAAQSGARVLLLEENNRLGGRLCFDEEEINGEAASVWAESAASKLEKLPNVSTLKRTTAFGYYDQNMVCAVQRLADHQSEPDIGQDRQQVRWIRAQQIVIASGSIERGIPFTNNDIPNIMLASAARGYANRFAVQCGSKAVVFTNNDSAYATVSALKKVGVAVAAVVDSRSETPGAQACKMLGDTERLQGHVVIRAHGRHMLKSIEVGRLVDNERIIGQIQTIDCDLLCVSGGWTPTIHLFSQAQGKLRFDETLGAFVPETRFESIHVAGSANGKFSLSECLREGTQIGFRAAELAGFTTAEMPFEFYVNEEAILSTKPIWQVPSVSKRRSKRFVDLQNDVTVEDIELTHREGLISVEHLKRYTTLGMGTDQGRTSNINGLANLARLRESKIPEVGHTTFRPPFTPIALGAIASGDFGRHLSPVRRTALHHWHVEHGARMQNSGVWKRAAYYRQTGEQIRDTILRETRHVRAKVGIVDVSSLGKIEVQGRDAAEFLERVYINRWKSLPVGKCRYGLMLREDGFVFDDGTSTRIAENEFYMTTTTANAGPVLEHLEFYAQTIWPQLHVHLTSVSDQWAGLALAGPHSRDVLGVLIGEQAASNESLPFMGYLSAKVADVTIRVFRVSFSGELAYEIHMPADRAVEIWEAVIDAGEPWDIAPYGLEAMTVLRIEKGHVVTAELDGRTTASDLGFGRMMKKDVDFVGKRLAMRPALVSSGRKQLVGLISLDGRPIPRGSQILQHDEETLPADMKGHATSVCYSPHLEKNIGLGLLKDGCQLYGKRMYASSPLTGASVPIEIAHHIFFDPSGARTRG